MKNRSASDNKPAAGNRSAVYLSEAAEPAFKQYIAQTLLQMGVSSEENALREVHATDKTYAAVASHADMYHCNLGSRIVSGFPSGSSYPENVGFNGVRLGHYFIHSLQHTAPEVLCEAERLGLTPVNVKQGYTKCSLVVVEAGFLPEAITPAPSAACESHRLWAEKQPFILTEKRPAVITADCGIAKTLDKLPIDVLLIRPGYVRLPGFPYGFLGGASGLIGDQLLFHGNLISHPDSAQIIEFIQSHGKHPVWFSDFPLTDIGSIITLL